MFDEDFKKITNSLRISILKYPNCKIANCDCDSKHGERKTKSNGEKCYCLCHIDEIIKENSKGEKDFLGKNPVKLTVKKVDRK